MKLNKRPNLNKDINLKDFKDFYWLKEELVTFCREIGINSSGGKIDIANKIEVYLRTGKIERKRTSKSGKTKKGIQKIPENIVSYQLYNRGINLPNYFDLTEDDVGYVCKTLKKLL